MLIRNMSTKGRIELTLGAKPYTLWTKKEIISAIKYIKFRKPEPMIYFKNLESISEDVLKEYILAKHTWHHVNTKPLYFYAIYVDVIESLTNEDINEMIAETITRANEFNKPKLVECKVLQWDRSAANREFCRRIPKRGVLYRGNIYFLGHHHVKLHPDQCEIVKIYRGKLKGANRTMYDQIRQNMRKECVYC